MNKFEIRWKNFRSLRDTGWLPIKPLTVVIGANATGKTSLLAPLLLLKQTIESTDSNLALKTVGDYFNAGSYKNLVWEHNEKNVLELGFRFNNKRKNDKSKREPVGKVAPNEISFMFAYSDEHESPVLLKYIVRDSHGRVMLTRSRIKNGKYSVRLYTDEENKKKLSPAIRASMPDRFVFTTESAFKKQVAKEIQTEEKGKEVKAKEFRLEFSQSDHLYLGIVSFVKGYVEKLLKEIAYIGPLSEPPKRIYELSGEKPKTVGVRGEFAPEVLYRERATNVMRKVDHWISVFDFGSHIKCKTLADGIFNLTMCKGEGSPEVNIADTGFGLSQVLPLVVQGCYGDKNSLMIAEQPEVHLNPRLQALLADVFCETVNGGAGVLVETHSEHFLLRLRRMIAERMVDNEKVAIYFVEKDEDSSSIRSIPVDSKGHIDPSVWPKGFFEESLKEALGLASAQAKRRD